MKTLQLSIIAILLIGLVNSNYMIFAQSSSTPENVGTGQYHYANDTQQSLFIIPTIVAVISIITGLAIYAGTKSIKK